MVNIIFLVHGTWGKGSTAWYQESANSESFSSLLKNYLKEHNLRGSKIIIPFEWSGDNTHEARILASEDLSNELLQLRKKYPSCFFHFIAHSHGGNVVLKSIEYYFIKLRALLVNIEAIDKENHPPKKENINWNAWNKWQIVTLLNSRANIKDGHFYRKEYPIEKINRVFKTYDFAKYLPLIDEHTYLIKNKKSIGSIIEKFDKAGIYVEDDTEIIINPILDMLCKNNQIEKQFEMLVDKLLCTKEFHRIYSVSTLGTPFYFKTWSKSILSIISLAIIAFSFTIIRLIVGILIFSGFFHNAGIISITYDFPWVGFDITSWNPMLLAFIIILSLGEVIYMMNKHPYNTNVYFDCSNIDFITKNLGKNKICSISIFHAKFLDEAYFGLSSFNKIGFFLKKKLVGFGKPKLWDFKRPSKLTGAQKESIFGSLHLFRSYFNEMIKNILNLVAYKVKLKIIGTAVNIISNITKMGLLGIPKKEFVNGDIEVKTIPETKDSKSYDVDSYFHLTAKNVEEHFKEIEHTSIPESNRYDFLDNNGGDLNIKIGKSMLFKDDNNSFKLGDEQKKYLLMLEERGKEFFGVVGLRHSMYYEKREVINQISKAIADTTKQYNK